MNLLQGADVRPTTVQLNAIAAARAQAGRVMARWNTITTLELAALNAKLSRGTDAEKRRSDQVHGTERYAGPRNELTLAASVLRKKVEIPPNRPNCPCPASTDRGRQMNRNITAAMIGCVSLLGGAFATAQQDPRTLATQPPQWESCEEMHDMYVRRFESARGFGLSRMPQPAMLNRSGVLDTGRIRYAIDSIELIGLLKPGGPVAYVPELHSARPTAADFKSRPLGEFENAADRRVPSGQRHREHERCVGRAPVRRRPAGQGHLSRMPSGQEGRRLARRVQLPASRKAE